MAESSLHLPNLFIQRTVLEMERRRTPWKWSSSMKAGPCRAIHARKLKNAQLPVHIIYSLLHRERPLAFFHVTAVVIDEGQ